MKAKRSEVLLDAIHMRHQTVVEDLLNPEPRDFFRGSEVGNCSNQINYRRKGFPIPVGNDLTKQQFLEDGHLHQSVLSKELREAGFRFVSEEAEVSKRMKWKGTIFKVVGHTDGVIEDPEGDNEEDNLLEVKSLKTDNFQEIVRHGNIERFYAQIQIYLHLSDLRICRLVIVDRNSSARIEFTVKKDIGYLKELLDKLRQIEIDISNGEQSKRDYPRNSKQCGWCPYYEACWGIPKGFRQKGDSEARNVEVEGKHTQTFEAAIDLYKKYQRLDKEAKKYKTEATMLGEILFKKLKATRVHGPGGHIQKIMSTRQVPDKSTINELVARGTIPVNFVDSVSARFTLDKEDDEREEGE